MQKCLTCLIIPISMAVFLIGLDWGLPTEDRFKQVFGTEDNFYKIKKDYQTKKDKGPLTSYEQTIEGRSNLAVSFPYSGDEHYVLDAIKNLNPGKLEFDPKFYMYGGGFMYTEAVFLQFASWLKYFKVERDFDYYKKNPGEIGKAYYVMRLAVVIFAAVGIFLTVFLAKKYFGLNIAVLSWIILLVMPMTHQATHTAEPHIFVLPFFILSFYFCLKSLKTDIRKNYILAAIFAGLTIGTQATSIYIVCPFFMSLYLNKKEKYLETRDAFKYFLLYTAVSITIFFLINPFYIINYKEMLGDLNRGSGNQLRIVFKTWASSELSWFLMILIPLSSVYSLFKSKNDKIIALFVSTVLPGIAVYFFTNYHMPYVYSTAALSSVLTALMLVRIYKNLRKFLKPAYVILISVFFVISPAGHSVYYYLNFTSQNSDEAGRWMNQNAPAGAKIGVFYPPSLWDCAPFNYNNYKLVDYRNLAPGDADLPEFIISSAQPPSLPEDIKPLYDITKIYQPQSLFGFHYKLKGELQALIAKTTIIYSLKKS